VYSSTLQQQSLWVFDKLFDPHQELHRSTTYLSSPAS